MRKQLPALIVVLAMLVLPSSAQALETDELIAIAAMPLAVAAVADLTDVPRTDLITTVTTLNRAVVPAPQFIEVVRYSPVAFVDTREPRFVTYVTTQYDRGVVGDALALSIADRYQYYGIQEVNVVNPPVVTTYVERTILPQVVVTRFQPMEVDPLALIAMPLAVAAVSEITNVPRSDLFDFIATLNAASVPPAQFVEIVRYSPVMFVDPSLEPRFMTFVTTEVDRGISGNALAFAIADQFRTVGVTEIDLVNPPTRVIVDRDVDVIVPPVVVSRVAAVSGHPHGGPPGQLKKTLGVQTGAEVVHGSHPSGRARVTTERPRDRDRDRTRVVRPSKPKVERHVIKQQRVPKQRTVKVKPRVVKQQREFRQPEIKQQKVKPQKIQQQSQQRSSDGGGGKPAKGQGKGKGKGKG